MIVWRRCCTGTGRPGRSYCPPLAPFLDLRACKTSSAINLLALSGLSCSSTRDYNNGSICAGRGRGREDGWRREEVKQSFGCYCYSVWQLQNICIFTFDLLLSLPCVNCQSEGANKQQGTTTKALCNLCIYAYVCVCVFVCVLR